MLFHTSQKYFLQYVFRARGNPRKSYEKFAGPRKVQEKIPSHSHNYGSRNELLRFSHHFYPGVLRIVPGLTRGDVSPLFPPCEANSCTCPHSCLKLHVPHPSLNTGVTLGRMVTRRELDSQRLCCLLNPSLCRGPNPGSS